MINERAIGDKLSPTWFRLLKTHIMVHTLVMVHFKQEHSKTCGIAAMRMMLSAIGEGISEKEYLKLVPGHSFGTFSTDLAVPLLERGIKVKAYTWNLPVFGHLNKPTGEEILEENLIHGLKTPSTKMIAESVVSYLRSGGKLFWQPPTIELLKKAAKTGPLLVSLNTASLGDYWRRWDNGHYLVITEVGTEKSFVHDPYYDEAKGSYWVENERLIPAVTVNAIRSTDFCMILTPGSQRSTKNN